MSGASGRGQGDGDGAAHDRRPGGGVPGGNGGAPADGAPAAGTDELRQVLTRVQPPPVESPDPVRGAAEVAGRLAEPRVPGAPGSRRGLRRISWIGRPGHNVLRRPARHRRRLVPRLLERGLRRVTEAPLIRGNRAELLVDALAAYPAMLALIRSASRTICFENYIIRDDAVGQRFAEALEERARAGVQVRVLYDWLGSLGTSRGFWRRLRHAGVQVRDFGGPSLARPVSIFTRDHRKLLVVDGRAGVVGGFCIGAEWEDDRGRGRWRDTAVRVAGPVAVEMERAFDRVWHRAGGEIGWHGPYEAAAEVPAAGDVAIRVVDGPPAHARTYRLYQLLAALAERTLYVTGAYPLAPTPLRRALVSAARAGVDVRLLFPDRSDLRLLNQAARAHFTRLLRNGVRIYLWNGPMLHAKTLVVDQALALVGSSNLNPFSLLGCYELDLQLQNAGIAGELHLQYLRDLERSSELTLERWKRRPALERLKERIGAALLWLPYKLYSG